MENEGIAQMHYLISLRRGKIAPTVIDTGANKLSKLFAVTSLVQTMLEALSAILERAILEPAFAKR